MEEKAFVYTKNNVHIVQTVMEQVCVSIEDESQDAYNAMVLKYVFIDVLSSTVKSVEARKYVFMEDWNPNVYNVVEIVFVFTHVLGQGALCVTEEASAFTKEYEHDAKTVVVLKYVHISEDEQRVLFAKVNAKQ